jgi:hypothetical protein
MGTINTSTQSGGPRMRLNISTGVPTQVTTFLWQLDQRFLKLKLKFEVISDDLFLNIITKKKFQVRVAFCRALNSPIHARYDGYSDQYYHSTLIIQYKEGRFDPSKISGVGTKIRHLVRVL